MSITPKELRKLEEIHELVVKKGLSKANQLGQTAIFLAVQSGDVEVVQTLINQKVNLEHRDNNDDTVIMRAANMAQQTIVNMLIKG